MSCYFTLGAVSTVSLVKSATLYEFVMNMINNNNQVKTQVTQLVYLIQSAHTKTRTKGFACMFPVLKDLCAQISRHNIKNFGF